MTNSTYLYNALEYYKTTDISIVNSILGGTTYNKTIEKDI